MTPSQLERGKLYTRRGHEGELEFERRVAPRHPQIGRCYFAVVGSTIGKMLTDFEVRRNIEPS